VFDWQQPLGPGVVHGLIYVLLLMGVSSPARSADLPPFLRAPSGTQLQEMLQPGVRVLQELSVDLDGDHVFEQLVLLGLNSEPRRPATAVLVCRKHNRMLEWIAATRLTAATQVAAEMSLASDHIDLTGDGVSEVVVEERLSGPDLSLQIVTYWQLRDDKLALVYTLTTEYRFRERSERRSLQVISAGRLVEEIQQSQEGHPPMPPMRVELRFLPGLSRFAPVQHQVVR